MTSKIQELTEKIYQEGVDKAQNQANILLKEAEEKATGLINDAQLKADNTILEAERKSKEIYRDVQEELQSISRQVIAITKQKITDSIVTDSSKKITKVLFDDKHFLRALILELVNKWDMGDGSIDDLSLILSEEQLKELDDIFKSGALQILQSNKQILFDPSIKNGFQIISNSEGFKVSFSDEDLENFFKIFMKPRIQEYLFTSPENA
jgi:V/A-type H+-transporting ATPase subunit E